MNRLSPRRRGDWQAAVERLGFAFHTIEGDLYWDESVAYSFTLKEIEQDIEAPTGEIEALCLSFVDRALRDDAILTRLAIPPAHWDLLRQSWQRGDRNLYGRLDLAYDGTGPAKLLEYNADTPTALFEAAVVQWDWLEQAMEQRLISPGCDQFNSIHERLIEAFRQLWPTLPPRLHFAADLESAEDRGTVEYLRDCADQAGHETRLLSIEEIGLSTDGRFADGESEVISHLFKLYPWEWLFREAYGSALAGSDCRFVEPPWKAVLLNKGLLAYLWEMEPGHPNLLPTFFETDPAASALGRSHVRKPLYSREGANVSLVVDGEVRDSGGGPYGAEGFVLQDVARMPSFGGRYPVLGSWLVASQPCGLGIREDETPITKDSSRFVPHIIEL
ncbi:glutathionylspermidine synthase family protein [Enterovirga rhinocerotis]|uniref:Glutathionylspermidine synthase n=1 Tax=Enterovirga rhinocerotis TaxID=1339210 RepID=A0A4R7BNI0_9HYPH|nr:glutathionylspermidine synthase family protein [Enterovirga rhinocerotis]TDR85487.1 glutathionylspermidine synthase [Enterovirga rhinocerotis]